MAENLVAWEKSINLEANLKNGLFFSLAAMAGQRPGCRRIILFSNQKWRFFRHLFYLECRERIQAFVIAAPIPCMDAPHTVQKADLNASRLFQQKIRYRDRKIFWISFLRIIHTLKPEPAMADSAFLCRYSAFLCGDSAAVQSGREFGTPIRATAFSGWFAAASKIKSPGYHNRDFSD